MPLIVYLKYTASARGSTTVAVRCEDCGEKYYYQLSRVAYGQGSALYGFGREQAQRDARRNAERRLQRMLDNDIDPVPCPACGRYQKKMVPLLRRRRLGWMLKATAACLAGGAILLVALVCLVLGLSKRDGPALVPDWLSATGTGLAALLLLGVPTLPLARWVLNRLYDPNTAVSQEERVARGRELTITREEAEDLMYEG